MDINILREAVTVVSFGAFIGVVVFAVHPRNKERFEEAALLPLHDDMTPSPALPQGGGSTSVLPQGGGSTSVLPQGGGSTSAPPPLGGGRGEGHGHV